MNNMDEFEAWFLDRFGENKNSVEMMLLKPHLSEAWVKGRAEAAKVCPVLTIRTLNEMHSELFNRIIQLLRSERPMSSTELSNFFEKDISRTLMEIKNKHRQISEMANQ